MPLLYFQIMLLVELGICSITIGCIVTTLQYDPWSSRKCSERIIQGSVSTAWINVEQYRVRTIQQLMQENICLHFESDFKYQK